MTWHRDEDGYHVFFNRDELKTRGRAEPPREWDCRGIKYLAPRDVDGGGTWLLANERGVVLALLNSWTPKPPAGGADRPSRGRLLTDHLADCDSALAATERLRQLQVGEYPGFTLAAFDLSQVDEPLLTAFDGADLREANEIMPVCSSSFRPEDVTTRRKASLREIESMTAESLWRWHTNENAPSAYTVRMNRPDAQTWSISRVTVRRGKIAWLYQEEPPDLAGPVRQWHAELPV